MRFIFSACTCLILLSSCGPNPAASKASGSQDATAATAKILVSKQVYLDFLSCARESESSAQGKATIDEGIKNVNGLPEESFTALKANLSLSAQDFAARYGSCVK